MKILVCAHKEDYVRSDDLYTPIQVGCDLTDKDLGFLKDNTGDNISSKNGSFCELTALYWAWKNLPDEDIIGLAHYRRYLHIHSDWVHSDKIIASTNEDSDCKAWLNKTQIENILSQCDIIVASKRQLRMSIAAEYSHSHIQKDLHSLETVVSELYPEYIESFKSVMQKRSIISYNMFIAHRELVNDYCQWLFNILFELEKRIDLSEYTTYQKRIYGFMGERLQHIYIHKHKFNVKSYPILHLTKAQKRGHFYRRLQNTRRFIKYKIREKLEKVYIGFYSLCIIRKK